MSSEEKQLQNVDHKLGLYLLYSSFVEPFRFGKIKIVIQQIILTINYPTVLKSNEKQNKNKKKKLYII